MPTIIVQYDLILYKLVSLCDLPPSFILSSNFLSYLHSWHTFKPAYFTHKEHWSLYCVVSMLSMLDGEGRGGGVGICSLYNRVMPSIECSLFHQIALLHTLTYIIRCMLVCKGFVVVESVE